MKRIDFNIPTETGPELRAGYRIWLDVAGVKHAFMLQLDGQDRPRILADYASGYKLCDLGPLMLERYVGHPAAYGEGLHVWRAEAQLFIDRTIGKMGLDIFRAKLDSVPVINEVK